MDNEYAHCHESGIADETLPARIENRLCQLLAALIQDYDRRNSLKSLLEVSSKTRADLRPAFGRRSHVNEVLNGKRAISTFLKGRQHGYFNPCLNLLVPEVSATVTLGCPANRGQSPSHQMQQTDLVQLLEIWPRHASKPGGSAR